MGVIIWVSRVFDGEVAQEFPILIPSCSTFTPPPYGPDTCVNGYVWREAYGSNDHVCVVPATRAQAVYDNSQAASRIDPNGAYGPDTCINGYVWREASKGIDYSVTDHVCVVPATRAQAAYDNTQAPYFRLFP